MCHQKLRKGVWLTAAHKRKAHSRHKANDFGFHICPRVCKEDNISLRETENVIEPF
jgi:hypothetical protein